MTPSGDTLWALAPEELTALLGGMKQSVPPQAFAAVWDLAGRVLGEKQLGSLRQRLGVG